MTKMVSEQYQLAQKRLKTGIKASKEAALDDLRSLADEDSIRKPDKVIMKKLRVPNGVRYELDLRRVLPTSQLLHRCLIYKQRIYHFLVPSRWMQS